MADEIIEHWVPWQEQGPWLTPLETGRHHVIRVRREVIPVIFVPGIMGSRLERSSNSELVWDPESTTYMLWHYHGMTAQARHQRIIGGPRYSPTFLRPVSNRTQWRARLARSSDTLSGLRAGGQRGFEGVSYGSYKDIIKALFLREKETGRKTWSDRVRRCFRLPVYSFGYNWTASNEDAGRELAARVTRLISDYASAGKTCRFAILVTHSMGGLVSRSALHSVAGFSDKVLGVIHGVQPVTGSPAAYWRMKAGFERPGVLGGLSANVLGPSAPEVTAILAHMPGGLQLLPTHRYRTNGGSSRWLHILDPHAPRSAVVSLPNGGNPYASIYRERSRFWRLVDEAHLRPGGGGPAPQNPNHQRPGQDTSPWGEYLRVLGIAERFHSGLGVSQHPRTRAFFGTGRAHETAARVLYRPDRSTLLLTVSGWRPNAQTSTQDVHQAVQSPRYENLLYRTAHYDALVRYAQNSALWCRLLPATGGGDGTVPESSGRGLNLPIATTMPPEPAGLGTFEPLQLGMSGLEHEPAYKDNTFSTSDSHTFVFRSIEALCRDLIAREAR